MFESTGWNLVEDINDPDNYDSSISTYVRPKQEQSLTVKLEKYKVMLMIKIILKLMKLY